MEQGYTTWPPNHSETQKPHHTTSCPLEVTLNRNQLFNKKKINTAKILRKKPPPPPRPIPHPSPSHIPIRPPVLNVIHSPPHSPLFIHFSLKFKRESLNKARRPPGTFLVHAIFNTPERRISRGARAKRSCTGKLNSRASRARGRCFNFTGHAGFVRSKIG